MKRYAIIVAGGSGRRFGSVVPKQFLALAGRPVLMHTVEKFVGAGAEVVLVLPAQQMQLWRQLCQQHGFTLPVKLAAGGGTRCESVQNGLNEIAFEPDDLVAVHDGVRPLVSEGLIERAFTEAGQHGSAIPVVPVTDTIRQIDGEGKSHTLDRNSLAAVQTPQVFNAITLLQSYAAAVHDRQYTDDASVMEAHGHELHLVKGDPRNIKITNPGDIAIAEAIMKNA